MAKKKKKKSNIFPFVTFDTHHIFFSKLIFNGKWTAKLRSYPYCIATIPKSTLHKDLHKDLRYVPVPKEVNAEDALNQLETLKKYGAISDDDNLVKKLTVLVGIFECSEQPTADALRKQLAVAKAFYEEPP